MPFGCRESVQFHQGGGRVAPTKRRWESWGCCRWRSPRHRCDAFLEGCAGSFRGRTGRACATLSTPYGPQAACSLARSFRFEPAGQHPETLSANPSPQRKHYGHLCGLSREQLAAPDRGQGRWTAIQREVRADNRKGRGCRGPIHSALLARCSGKGPHRKRQGCEWNHTNAIGESSGAVETCRARPRTDLGCQEGRGLRS